MGTLEMAIRTVPSLRAVTASSPKLPLGVAMRL
jgi:hypothetical protein